MFGQTRGSAVDSVNVKLWIMGSFWFILSPSICSRCLWPKILSIWYLRFFMMRLFLAYDSSSVKNLWLGGSIGNSWIQLLPGTHQIYSYVWNDSLWNNLKTSWTTLSQQKIKDLPIEKVGEAGTISLKTPHQHGDPQEGEISHVQSFPQRSKCFMPISHTPAHGTCTGEMCSQNIWLRKPKGLTSKGPRGL